MEKTVLSLHLRRRLACKLAMMAMVLLGVVRPTYGQSPLLAPPTYDDSSRALRFALHYSGSTPEAQDFKVEFPHNYTRTLAVTAKDSATVEVTAALPRGVFPGANLVALYYQKKLIWKDTLVIPNAKAGPDEQPVVSKIEPLGGFVGNSISITGKNFGDNLNALYIWLGDAMGQPYDADFNPIPATYLSSPDAAGNQEVRFYYPAIPEDLLHREKWTDKWWLSRQHRLWVFCDAQPSATARGINLVNSDYRTFIFLITLGMFVLIGALMWVIFKVRKGSGGSQPWYMIVVDSTNRISLAKVQVLGWTVLLGFGYTYYALMRWLVVDDGSIPDFPASLLVLLGVTSGGALITMAQGKNDSLERAASPQLRDLVYQGAELSLSRLQLVVFTLITMALYITYLADPQLVFHGMPEVPMNLLLLMGISQGGAIAGNAIEGGGNVRRVSTNVTAVDEPATETTSVPTEEESESKGA